MRPNCSTPWPRCLSWTGWRWSRCRAGPGARSTARWRSCKQAVSAPRRPRRRPPATDQEVPPHRRRAAPPRGRGGFVPGRVGAPVSRLRPVAAQPDGAPGRPGRDLPAGLGNFQRRLSHPVPLVPLPAPGRRSDPARRQDRRDRPAGTHRRPHRFRQAALAAARRVCARSGAHPDDRSRCGSGTPAGCSPAAPYRPCWPWKAGRSWPGRATGYGVPPPSTPPLDLRYVLERMQTPAETFQ